MQIVIIGSGNVATVLGRLCKQKGHTILQVMSRNEENAKTLAQELGCDYTNYNGKTNMNADLYLVAISDGILFDLNKSFKLGNKLIVHTAGSVSKEVLEGISTNYGVLYPFQSLRKETRELPSIPILVDANNEESITILESFAQTLSNHVKRTTDDERIKLHVSGVFVSNFTNHLYALANDFCNKENLDFSLLYPLMTETAVRATKYAPEEVQTGPALRKDVFTLDKHLKTLATHPNLKYLYLKITDSIMNWRN
jgi:predicted short-subunit dehydrogenase-like oxidoreductase (DUF2520 family)